jgi:hypothetical protein
MSIEPFFRDEPLLRDDSPDTRKDVVTLRHDDDLYAVDTPPTYAMGLAERLAALHHPDALPSSANVVLRSDGSEAQFELTTITLDDLDLNEPLEDFDPNADFDRETLPSAPYPPAILDDGAASLTWDVPPAPVPSFPNAADLPWDQSPDPGPAEETRSPLESSIWGKLQRFVTGISSKPRTLPPVSSSSHRKLSQRAIFELIWTFDNAALDGLSSHIERILAARRLGPEAYAESRILDLLDNMLGGERGLHDGVGISLLRSRITEVARPMFDHALLRLENRGVVMLLADDTRNDRSHEGSQDGIFDPVRGELNRCILLQSAG